MTAEIRPIDIEIRNAFKAGKSMLELSYSYNLPLIEIEKVIREAMLAQGGISKGSPSRPAP